MFAPWTNEAWQDFHQPAWLLEIVAPDGRPFATPLTGLIFEPAAWGRFSQETGLLVRFERGRSGECRLEGRPLSTDCLL
jgi:hypothetical protein